MAESCFFSPPGTSSQAQQQQRQPNISEAASEKTVYTWQINEASLPLRIIPLPEVLNPVDEPERDTSTSILDSKVIQSPSFVRGQGIGRPGEWQLTLQNSTREGAAANQEVDLVLQFKRHYVHSADLVWVRIGFEITDEDGNIITSSVNVFDACTYKLEQPSSYVYPLGSKTYLQLNRGNYILNGTLHFRIRLNIYKDLGPVWNLGASTSSSGTDIGGSGEPASKRQRLESSSTVTGLTDLLVSLTNLWNTRETTGDVTITCGDRSSKSHKFVLSGRSKVFAGMLDSKMNSTEKETMTVKVEDIEPVIMEALLEFMYLGECSKFDWYHVDHLCALIHAADKYWVTPLSVKCFQALMRMMSLENFGKIAKVTFLYDSERDFKDQVRHFYECNQVTLNGIPSFRNFANEDYEDFLKLFFHSIV